MHFSRIRMENWRNFADVNVPVEKRVFLVGANASGKSNFLDALRFLRDLVTTGGGFESAVEKRGGVSKIRNLAARRESHVTLDVELGDGEQRLWRYRLKFSQDNRRRPKLLEEKVWHADDRLILKRPDENDENDAARLRQTHLEQVFANEKFRDIHEFFQSIQYSHIVPQLIRQPERYNEQRNDPFGSDFLQTMALTNKRTRNARLRRIQKALAIVAPGFSAIQLHRDARGTPHLRGKYEHWRGHGAWQEETEFSDGSLRLIGLMWAMQDGAGPLLLEELELSLHPEVVRLLPQMIHQLQRASKKAQRQVFISTHSNEMLDDEGIGAHETLLLNASHEGTIVRLAAEDENIMSDLAAGIPMAELVMARTGPGQPNQLLMDLH